MGPSGGAGAQGRRLRPANEGWGKGVHTHTLDTGEGNPLSTDTEELNSAPPSVLQNGRSDHRVGAPDEAWGGWIWIFFFYCCFHFFFHFFFLTFYKQLKTTTYHSYGGGWGGEQEGTKESSHTVGWGKGSLTTGASHVEGWDGETEASDPAWGVPGLLPNLFPLQRSCWEGPYILPLVLFNLLVWP